MRWTKALLMFSLFSLATAGAAAAQSDTAAGEERVSVIFLDSGVPVEYAFEDTNAVLFGFAALAGDVVDVTVTQAEDSTLDPYIVLLGSRGEVLAADDDSGEAPLASAISGVELPADGSYLILVTTFSGINQPFDPESQTEPQFFEVTVTGNSVPTDTIEEFILFSGNIDVNASTQGASIPAEPVFYYFLEVEEGQVLDITLTDTDYDSVLMVFDSFGERIGINDTSEIPEADSAVLGLEVAETGRWLIFATGYNFEDAYAPDVYEGGQFILNVFEAQ
jgi:hypothetical protein